MIFLLVFTSLHGIGSVFKDTRAWMGLIFGLGLCGTGLAYVIYYFIVENLGAVAASINPISYAAMIFILLGVALLQFGSRRRSQETSKGQTTVAQEVEGSTAAGLAQHVRKA